MILQGTTKPTIKPSRPLPPLSASMHSQKSVRSYSEEAAAATAAADHLELRHAPEGLLAAGTWICTPVFQAALTDACADLACHLMEEVQALQLGDQDHWLLLHTSL
jgi:hypothetical protein